jgi:hypothetical protein
MAVPWLQIVNLMPSILDVSRELLKRARKTPAGELPPPSDSEQRSDPLDRRVRALEENERRQAELVKTMADQLAQLADAATALHKVTRWLIAGLAGSAAVAVAALVLALR